MPTPKVATENVTELIREIGTKPLERSFRVDVRAADEESRVVELAFSSEDPYQRWWGTEILDHKPESIRLGRLLGGAPVLVEHDRSDHVGVVESVEIGTDKKARAKVRFGRSSRATEIFNDIKDGIRQLVSVGYMVHKMVLESETEGNAVYRVDDWEPFEISIVSVPADPTVGVGRSFSNSDEKPSQSKEEPIMGDKTEVTEPKVVVVESDDRKRSSEIMSLGMKYNELDLAKRFIENGESVDQFRSALLDRSGYKAIVDHPADGKKIGMDENEIKQFSFCRLLNALANPTDREAQKAAGFEIEASQAAAKLLERDAKGMIIPFDVLSHRDMTVGSNAGGGYTVNTSLESQSFIEMLENALVLRAAGVRVLTGLKDKILIPRQITGAVAYWVAENGVPTESAPTFDQVPMDARTVAAFTDISRKLLIQSSMSVEQFVRQDLATRIALAIDFAGIAGATGGNNPVGILNTSGIGAVVGGANGLAPAWSHIVKLETEVSVDNAAIGQLGYLTNSKVRGKLKETEKFTGGGREIWADGATPLNGYAGHVSNAVPGNLTKGSGTNLSAAIFGNFADAMIGLWSGLDILVNPYINSGTGAVRVEAYQDADFAVRHPQSFAAMVDIITT